MSNPDIVRAHLATEDRDFTADEIINATQLPRRSFYKAVWALLETGHVIRSGLRDRARYRLRRGVKSYSHSASLTRTYLPRSVPTPEVPPALQPVWAPPAAARPWRGVCMIGGACV